MHLPTNRITHTTAFDGSVVDHCLEWKISQTASVLAMQTRSDDPNHYRRMLYYLSYIGVGLNIKKNKHSLKLGLPLCVHVCVSVALSLASPLSIALTLGLHLHSH